jgi:serine/threonine-protein kinase
MVMADRFKLVGTVVDGRYRVQAVAGEGGYSVVYRAFHLSFESAIALKVLKLPTDLSIEARKAKAAEFRREGKVLFGLSSLHASIVKPFEAGVVALYDGSLAPYLALEWLNGVSLAQEIKYRRQKAIEPMGLQEVLELLDAPARALALAHAAGVVHRDIKPGNLFATLQSGGRRVKILDFGIAKILGDTTSTTTHLTDANGSCSSFTPMYAAPEQWLRRLGATGPWTDVHAWALVAVELLTGKAPLAGEESAQFMAACLDATVRPTPTTLGFDVGGEVEAVFARGLAVNPRERFTDLGAFWTALSFAARWSPGQVPMPVALKSLDSEESLLKDSSTEEVLSASCPTLGTLPDEGGPTASASISYRPRPKPGRLRSWILGGLGIVTSTLLVLALSRNSTRVRSHTTVARVNETVGEGSRALLIASETGRPFAYESDSVAVETRASPLESFASQDREAHSDRTSMTAQTPKRAAPRASTAPNDAVEAAPRMVPEAAEPAGVSPRNSSAQALEQLMKNEELVHRR